MYFHPAHISWPLGKIWFAGSTNPLVPVSRSSKVKEYSALPTSPTQSVDEPEVAYKVEQEGPVVQVVPPAALIAFPVATASESCLAWFVARAEQL